MNRFALLLTVALATGAGVTAQASSTVCNGSGANPVALGTTTAGPLPCLGCAWELQIDHTSFLPGATFDFFVGSIGSCASFTTTPFGEVLWNPLSSIITEARVAGGTLLIDVPNNPAFIGLPMSIAGASFELSSATLTLTNALDGVVDA